MEIQNLRKPFSSPLPHHRGEIGLEFVLKKVHAVAVTPVETDLTFPTKYDTITQTLYASDT